MRRRPPANDEGVSVIIGAILLLAIVVSAVAVVQTSFIPSWEKRAEVDHMRKVAASFATLAGTQPRATGDADARVVEVPLRPDRPLFGGDGLGGHTVSFEPNASTITVHAGRFAEPLAATDLDDAALFETEAWLDLPPDGTLIELEHHEALHHLRLRPERVGTGPAMGSQACTASGQDGDVGSSRAMTVVARANPDHTTASAWHEKPWRWQAKLVLEDVTTAEGHRIDVTVKTYRAEEVPGPDGPKVFWTRDEPFHFQAPVAWIGNASACPFWLDVLDPRFQFARLVHLKLQEGPVELEIAPGHVDVFGDGRADGEARVRGGLDGHVAVVTEEPAPGGPPSSFPGVGGTFELSRSFETGRLTYRADNQHYVTQVHVVERGFYLLRQGDGEAVRQTPLVALEDAGSATRVRLDLAGLTGPAQTLAGADAAAIELSPVPAVELRGYANSLNLTIVGELARTWRDHLAVALDAYGFEATSNETLDDGQYRLTLDGDTLELSMIGKRADQESVDLLLDVRHAAAHVSLAT